MTTEVAQLISLLGFPAVALLAIAAAVWRCATWLAPMVKNAIDAHVSLMDTMRIHTERQTVMIGQISSVVADLNDGQRATMREWISSRDNLIRIVTLNGDMLRELVAAKAGA